MDMTTGLCVTHLFCKAGATTEPEAITAAIESARADGVQVVTAAILGHKGDLCVMGLSSSVTALRTLQSELQRAGLLVVDSYVSITELSEYAQGLPEHMAKDRLYPELPPPDKPAFCFYPMSKRRDAHVNWYATPFQERRDMMMEHGGSGRAFAGKIVQLVTASTGLDNHEWGVTLFGLDLEVIKDVVYTLRYDKGSALYGDFGEFYVGYLASVDQLRLS